MKYAVSISLGSSSRDKKVEVKFNDETVVIERIGLDGDVAKAKRAGFFHDIGKSVDHDTQGTHTEIGYTILKKFKIDEDLREELVLAIAEAAQNIVKHAYKDMPDTQDKMVVRISCNDDVLEISFFDKGKPVEKSEVKHRAIDDIKPGGLGTFFIQQIMDSINFEPGKEPWINNLVLTKKLKN